MELMKQTKMSCANCGGQKWHNVDEHRIKKIRLDPLDNKSKPMDMALCVDCGFVSYPNMYSSNEEILTYYRKAYRKPPSHFNLFTGERKNHYHLSFLNDLFLSWKEKGFDTPKIAEIGAAFGPTLNLMKHLFPKGEMYGTEITTSFRRNAFHEYGIKLDEELDETKKYDLMISYKVLEHQMNPLSELEKYQRCLSDDGKLYISVPTWFNSLCNFGLPGFDLE